MTTVVTKQAMANLRAAKAKEYEIKLRSGESVSPAQIPTMIAGFDDGVRSLLHALLDQRILEWSPEPTPIEERRRGETY